MMKSFKQFISETKIFGIGPNGIGSWIHDDGHHNNNTVTQHPTKDTVGNEPFKNTSYFRRPNIGKYINNIRKSIGRGENVEAVSGTPHPGNPNIMSILDGNHRLQATRNARKPTVDVRLVSHEDIRLLHPDHKELDTLKDTVMQGTPLSSFRERDGSYNMNTPRKELGGLTLGHYFANATSHGVSK